MIKLKTLALPALGFITLCLIGTSIVNKRPKTLEMTVPATTLTTTTPAQPAFPTTKTVKNLTLNADNVTYLSNEVTEESVNNIIARIQENEDSGKDLYIIINSPGGSVFAGARLIAYMEASTVNVNTVCVSLCASMSAQLFEHGKKRYMIDGAGLMFHQASGGVEGPVKGMKNLLGYVDREVQKLDAYVADRSGISRKAWDDLVSVDYWVAADDAIQAKLADGLVVVNVKGQVETKFHSPYDNGTNYLRLHKELLYNNPLSSFR
jgi:ATP-dependent Clp protease protease subunit